MNAKERLYLIEDEISPQRSELILQPEYGLLG